MHDSIKQKADTGFTLIEILVASVIFILALGIIYNTYFSGLDIWEVGRYQAELQAQARIALNYMVSELRNATRTSTQNPSPNLSIPSVPNNKNMAFYLPHDLDDDGFITDANGDIEWETSNRIEYQYIPGQKELRRLEKGVQRILARDVTDIQFIDINIDPTLSINELRIVLALSKTTPRQRNISITLSSIVALRN